MPVMDWFKYEIPEIPPSLNTYAGRNNVWQYRSDKKHWAELCDIYCRPRPKKPLEKCTVMIAYYFKTRQRHDPDNYNGKFILDGLRDAGIIKDDSFANITLILYGDCDKDNPRTVVEVEEAWCDG